MSSLAAAFPRSSPGGTGACASSTFSRERLRQVDGVPDAVDDVPDGANGVPDGVHGVQDGIDDVGGMPGVSTGRCVGCGDSLPLLLLQIAAACGLPEAFPRRRFGLARFSAKNGKS